MITLYLDIKTSGFIRRDLPIDDRGQPSLIAIAAVLVDAQGRELGACWDAVRLPEGAHVSTGATAHHGISTRKAAREGKSEIVALGDLCSLAQRANRCVSDSADFDREMVKICLLRLRKPTDIWLKKGLEFIDVRTVAMPAVDLRDEDDSAVFKLPSLYQLSDVVLGEPYLTHDEYTAKIRETDPDFPGFTTAQKSWRDCNQVRLAFEALRKRNMVEENA